MNIAVVMTTYYPANEIGYARFNHATKVLDSLEKNLAPKVEIVISDDGSEIPCMFGKQYQFIHGPNSGVGASINRALLYLRTKWNLEEWAWIYIPDDLLLTKPINLTQAIKLIELGYDFVRLDLPHPNLLCKTKFQQDIGWWLDLDLKCEYSFATRPTLITSHLTEKLGKFKEFADSYAVELDYSHKVCDRSMDLLGAVSCDLGNAWQHLSSDEEAIGHRAINH